MEDFLTKSKAADPVGFPDLFRKSAAAMLLEPRIGERFNAIVTGASGKGTWVRIEDPPVEGRLLNGLTGLDVGHRIGVKLVRTDVERGFIDFEKETA